MITCLLIIVYCHGTVLIITRRHERQVQTKQIPAGENAERFLKEKKAWKTTGIIIGFLVLWGNVQLGPSMAKHISPSCIFFSYGELAL